MSVVTVRLLVVVGRRRVVLAQAVGHRVAGAARVVRHAAHTYARGPLAYIHKQTLLYTPSLLIILDVLN